MFYYFPQNTKCLLSTPIINSINLSNLNIAQQLYFKYKKTLTSLGNMVEFFNTMQQHYLWFSSCQGLVVVLIKSYLILQ